MRKDLRCGIDRCASVLHRCGMDAHPYHIVDLSMLMRIVTGIWRIRTIVCMHEITVAFAILDHSCHQCMSGMWLPYTVIVVPGTSYQQTYGSVLRRTIACKDGREIDKQGVQIFNATNLACYDNGGCHRPSFRRITHMSCSAVVTPQSMVAPSPLEKRMALWLGWHVTLHGTPRK